SRPIRAAEGFDTGLQEFGRLLPEGGFRPPKASLLTARSEAVRLPIPENRAQIAVARGPAGARRGEIVARHRDGQVRAQTELVSLRIGCEEHPLADVLAR